MSNKLNFTEYQNQVDYATYDPQDDKLRIYSGFVDEALYNALLEAGYRRAPKQECFFATWSPRREDVALALCGEIEDEDGSLLDRAEERAGRFSDYSGNAAKRSDAAYNASHEATKHIPMGQPILIGHYSEKAHRAALKRSDNAMRRSVDEKEKSDYWSDRASAAIRHAKYKLAPRTIKRRIKRLEADLRKYKRAGKLGEDELYWIERDWLKEHIGDPYTEEGQREPTDEEWEAMEAYKAAVIERRKQRAARWIDHIEGQLRYWKLFLAEEHGQDIDDQMPLEKGMWVKCRFGTWGQVVRVNRGAEKRITSVSVDRATMRGRRHWSHKWRYEDIVEFQNEAPEV